VTSPDNYFLSELTYSSESNLTDCKPISLLVLSLGDTSLNTHSTTVDTCERQLSYTKQQGSN